MNILEKLKQYFDKLFRSKNTHLLEEAKSMKEGKNEKENKNIFKEEIKEKGRDLPQWKEPNYEMKPIIMYDEKDISFVPIYLLEPPIMTKDSFDFDGANKYTLKVKEYDIIRRITSMAVDTIGMSVQDTSFSKEFNEKGSYIRLLFNTSSFFHENGDDDRAIADLENLLNNIVDFRNTIIDKEEKEEAMEK